MNDNIDRISNGLYMLIFGFVFLWISLGFMKINMIFQFLRLWPLFFVIVGIELIFKKTGLFFFKILSPVIVIGAIIGIVYFSQNGDMIHPRKIELFKTSQEIFSPEKNIDFSIEFSSGKLLISENVENLISGDLAVPVGVRPFMDFKKFDKENLYEIKSSLLGDYVFGPWDNERLWDIKISKNVPLKIKAKTYLSNNRFDLDNLSVSDLIIDTKFSSNEIMVNENIKNLRINSLGSKITILIPKGTVIKISLDKFLITDNFENLGLERGFKEFISPNYSEVEKKFDLDLDLKFSRLEIKFY